MTRTLHFHGNPAQAADPEMSFSAEGEDILVQRILKRMFYGSIEVPRERGLYVDVGAHDPWVDNNTAALWLKGWRGINIDPLPGVKERFDAARPGDQNFKLACSDRQGSSTLIIYDRPQLSSLSMTDVATLNGVVRGSKQVGAVKVEKDTLDNILAGVPLIDFLSVDVEGHELEILKGFYALQNRNSKQRPKVICVEVLSSSMEKFLAHAVVRYLRDAGYVCLSRLHCSAIFVDETRAIFR